MTRGSFEPIEQCMAPPMLKMPVITTLSTKPSIIMKNKIINLFLKKKKMVYLVRVFKN